MISVTEGGGEGSSSFRFRSWYRFRRTTLRSPPDILCDKNQQSEQVVRSLVENRALVEAWPAHLSRFGHQPGPKGAYVPVQAPWGPAGPREAFAPVRLVSFVPVGC